MHLSTSTSKWHMGHVKAKPIPSSAIKKFTDMLKYSCTHCGKGFPSVPNLFTHIEVAHPDPTFQGQENRRSGQVLRNGSSAERRLDMDGPMDIGELEFQVYDRPPTFAQNTPRYRAKGDYGLRSTKVPHGTYW